MTKTPVRLAVAAVVAQAPRLLLATAGIYGAPLPTSVRLCLAFVSALASAAVLTGGCAYLAHAVAVTERNRGLLALFWTCTALATVIILSPEIVAAIPGTHLSQVLVTSRAKWAFAITLAAFAEVVASGLAVAAASFALPPAAPRLPSRVLTLGIAGPPQIPATHADAAPQLPAEPPRSAPLPAAAVRSCPACGGSHKDSPQGKAAHARYCTGRKTHVLEAPRR